MVKTPKWAKYRAKKKVEPLVEELIALIDRQQPISDKTVAALHTGRAAKAIRAAVDAGRSKGKSRGDALGGLVRWQAGVESGVEATFACELYKVIDLEDPAYAELVGAREARYAELGMEGQIGCLHVSHQLRPVAGCRYRSDFSILFLCTICHPNGDPGTIEDYGVDLYVECDSIHTHGSAERVASDDRRARRVALEKAEEKTSTRMVPVRFSEAEIMRDGRGCALELVRIALSQMPDETTVRAQLIRCA